MVKTYSFLSGFVLRMMIGNLLVTPLMVLTGATGMILSPLIIMLTFFMGILWVVLKLLQAHFPEKTIEIPYTETTRWKQKIGFIISAVVSVVLTAASFLISYNQGISSFYVNLPFLQNVRVPNISSTFTFMAPAIIVLLANVYVGWFYRLAGQRRLPPQKEQSEEKN